ncbi:MAG: DUF4124 domain-containing protein [Pseudomonadota bacterium]|nr:DUF4124 domain-containing protein [Pseudomonadota bacterium]
MRRIPLLARRIALPCALALLAGAAPAQTIKRWVDERGVVHYGDALPARGATKVTEVPAAQPLSEQDKAAAEARMQQYRDVLAPTAPPPGDPASAPPAASGPAPGDQSCLAQWQRYDAAYACMDGHRVQGGGVRPDAYAQCPVVPQPNCPPPAGVLKK